MRSPAVRPATPADAPAIAAIARRPFAAGWSADAYAAEAAMPDALFLALDDGRVRGYAVLRPVDGEVQLLDFAVDEDGAGLGAALWDGAVEAARRRGARKLTLEVAENNARALAFYARRGAARAGRRPAFYADGAAALLLDVAL